MAGGPRSDGPWKRELHLKQWQFLVSMLDYLDIWSVPFPKNSHISEFAPEKSMVGSDVISF